MKCALSKFECRNNNNRKKIEMEKYKKEYLFGFNLNWVGLYIHKHAITHNQWPMPKTTAGSPPS